MANTYTYTHTHMFPQQEAFLLQSDIHNQIPLHKKKKLAWPG